jgi:hypothetical protein
MVEKRLTDGKRIAQLLASEVEGHGGALAGVSVVDADPDVEPAADGSLAYAVARGGQRIAEAYVHSDRARLELLAGQAAAADAASARDLRVRPKAVRPPRTIVFLEDGAAVKRAVRVLEATLAASGEPSEGESGGGDAGGASENEVDESRTETDEAGGGQSRTETDEAGGS